MVGCKEGECHYQRGTYLGRSKVALIDTILGQMGIPQARVRFAEMGSLDRFMLSSLIESMSAELSGLRDDRPWASAIADGNYDANKRQRGEI